MVLDWHAGRHGCRKHFLQIGEAHPYFLERGSIFFLQAGSDAFDHAFCFPNEATRDAADQALAEVKLNALDGKVVPLP